MGQQLEIRVLGGLELVSSSGTAIELSAPKQRELLGVLVTHAPHVMSTDRVCDALWPGEDDRRRSLQFHVSKLRDVVDPDRLGSIVTQPPGYRLDAERVDIDAHRFVGLVAEAEELVRVDPGAARRLLEEALGMWRGPPYAEFRYADWAQPEIARLEELHMAATELRVDIDLARGRHVELVPELEALVIESPLRERLWRQLMIALYRSGRQAEALRAFRRAREEFAEVGTAPSEDLARLENQILLRDKDLDAPSGAMSASEAGNLPVRLSSFVGRDRDMADVRDLVAEHRLVTLTGPGCVGKTSLAIEAATGLTGLFRDGVWLVEFAGLDDGDLVVSQIADALGTVQGAHGDVLARLVDFLVGRDVLVVLDNCEHISGPVSATVRLLLAQCPRLRVLATSRTPLGIEAEVLRRTAPLAVADADVSVGAGRSAAREAGSTNRLDGRTPDQGRRAFRPNRETPVRALSARFPDTAMAPAVQLFLDRARAARPSLEVAAGEEPLASVLCRRLAGLPLAIELAAARLRMMSLAQLVEGLDDQLELLTDGPSHSVGHHRAMRATMDWSYEQLDPPEQSLFRRLAVFRGGFTLETAERFHRTFPDSEGAVFQRLAHLVDASMVEPTPGDRFLMLEPVREYGLHLLGEHGEAAPARRGHAAVFTELFRIPDRELYGPPPGSPSERRFPGEHNNVRAALNWAAESGDTATLAELGTSAVCLLTSLGFLEEADDWCSRLLTVGDEATPHRARALARRVLLTAVLRGCEAAETDRSALVDTAEALDDDRWRALAIERRALLALLRDDFGTASELWDRATAELLRLGSQEAWLCLSNHMEALFQAGHYDRAEAVADQLAEVGVRFGISGLPAQALEGRSFIAVCRGDPDLAERCFIEAESRLRTDADDETPRFDPYGSMFLPAYIALLRDDVDEAERLGSAAMAIARRSRHPDAHLRGLVLMGLVHLRRGEPVSGRRYLVEMLAEASRTGLVYFQRYVLGAMAATWAMIEPERGAVLLAAVEALNRDDGRTLPAPIRDAVDRATAALDESSIDLESARQRGADMTLADAVELALLDS